MKQTLFYSLVLIFLGISIFSSTLSFAQQNDKQDQNTQKTPYIPYQEAGHLFVKNYSPKEYTASTQNWAIEQNKNGVIYVGNTTHLLSFDGKTWERIKIGGSGVVRSLGYSPITDKMYIGGVGDLGYSYIDSLGNMKYISLLNQVPEKYKKFNDVWKTLVLGEEVFFLTKDFILKYAANKFSIISPRANTFLSAFVVNQKLYVQEDKIGIFEYKNDFLNGVEKTDFIYQNLIVGMVNHSENVVLIATQNGDFYTYNVIKNTLDKFDIEQNAFFKKNQIHHLVSLKNGQIAIGTATEGIVLIDKNGKWKNHISQLKGLQDNATWNLHVDKNGDLWVALSKGISHIQTSWAYTYFGEQSRLNKVRKVIRFNDILYAATEQGLAYYNPKLQIWENVDGILGQIWDLEIYHYNNKNSALLIAGQGGIFVLNPLTNKIEKVSEVETKHFLIDKNELQKVYISTSKGLKIMIDSYSKLLDTPLDEPLKRIVQVKENEIWAETEYKGIIKIDIKGNKEKEYKTTVYDSLNGLPNVQIRQLITSNNQLFVATSKGIYYLDTLKNEFTSAALLENTKGNTNFSANDFVNADISFVDKFIHYSTTENNNNSTSYWVVKDKQLFYYQNGKLIENALLSLPSADFYSIYEDTKYNFEENNIQKPIFSWIATSEGLYRYDNTQTKNIQTDSLQIFLRHILIGDSLVSKFEKHKLPTDFISFSVQMASPSFGKSDKLLYRYRLLPSTTNWSPWTPKDKIEFAILPSGEYTLEIQAKNDEQLSNTFLLDFEVETAWYQRWWAYIIYILLVFMLAVVFTYLHEKSLKTKNKELNALIAERTQEISQKTEELETQQQELLSQSQEVYNQKEELASQAEYLKTANREITKQKRALENTNRRLKKLSDITQEITSILDTEELIALVFQRVIGLMPAEGFGIGLLNENKNTIEFTNFIEKGEVLEHHEESMKKTQLPSVECLTTGKTIAVNNVAKVWKKRFEEQQLKVEKGTLPYAIIYVPLIAEGNKFGIMTVQTFYEMDYSEQDILLLQSIGSAIAIALSNIKAYNLIEQKNKEVTDSIRYAQTIQESILPTEKEIKRSIGDHYVIYQPKDIVSGDFYWIGYNDGYQYAAVADCTGHGVPGAFMSMLGSALLREILYEKEVTSPADILEHLDDGIRNSLRQTGKEGSNTDGMDILLIRYLYREDGKIELDFAGAKRPLIYQEAEGEIIQLRGTSRSIGGLLRKKKPFEEHHLTLLPRTMLFLTSDGLIDQPNKERKKYGTQRFLDKISEWGHLPISMQKTALLEDVENFREEEEQRDDITIMAINL